MNVFKSERKPFKLTFEISGVFETPVKNNEASPGQRPVIIRYDYDSRSIKGTNYEYITNIPIMVQINADLNKVKFYIESVLHKYEVSESSVKLAFVSSIAFSIHQIAKVTCKLQLLKEIID